MNTDHLLQKFKTHHPYLYGAIRDTTKQIQGFRRRHSVATTVTHSPQAKPVHPLATININPDFHRLNLVFDRLDAKTIEKPEVRQALTLATDFVNQYHFRLRIITRNNQPNPKLYLDFLKRQRLVIPEFYSFYNDSTERISSPTRHLDLSKNDIFFATSSSSLAAVSRTPRPILQFFCLQSATNNLPPEALPVTSHTDPKAMKGWLA